MTDESDCVGEVDSQRYELMRYGYPSRKDALCNDSGYRAGDHGVVRPQTRRIVVRLGCVVIGEYCRADARAGRDADRITAGRPAAPTNRRIVSMATRPPRRKPSATSSGRRRPRQRWNRRGDGHDDTTTTAPRQSTPLGAGLPSVSAQSAPPAPSDTRAHSPALCDARPRLRAGPASQPQRSTAVPRFTNRTCVDRKTGSCPRPWAGHVCARSQRNGEGPSAARCKVSPRIVPLVAGRPGAIGSHLV